MISLLSWAESGRVLTHILKDRLEALTLVAHEYPGGATIRTPSRRLHIVNDAPTIKHVLVDNAGNYNKGLGQAEARGLLGDGLLTGEGNAWRQQREALTPYLKARVVREKEGHLRDLATQSVSSLPTGQDWERIDLAEDIADYTLACLGATLGFKPPAAGPLIEALDCIQDEAMLLASTQGKVPLGLRPWNRRRVQHAQRQLVTLADESLASLPSSANQPAWATRAGMVSLLLAGYETTASTLGWTLHYLARRPLLQHSISEQDEDARRVKVGEAFREALRLRPPVWVISRRALSKDRSDGWDIQAGDDVLILPHAMHRSGEWSRPHDFEPARFAEGPIGPHLPYGAGPRGCPGVALAELEANLWLSAFLDGMEVRAPVGEPVRHHARMSQAPARSELLVRRRPFSTLEGA